MIYYPVIYNKSLFLPAFGELKLARVLRVLNTLQQSEI